jgi:glycosyltransferase involved in cell wall biosynthesis
MARSYDVCAGTVSDLPFDARVWKESRSLAGGGYKLALIGCRYEIDATQRRTEDGIDVVEVPFGSRQGSASMFERVRVLTSLWWEVIKTPAAIYHAHNIEVGPASWLAARLRRAKLVYDAHELYAEASHDTIKSRVGGFLNACVERFMMSQADEVITTNRSRAAVLEEAYDRPGIAILGNVPPRADTVDPVDPGYPKDAKILLYQGHISAESRAFRETIEALKELPDVHLAIIGFAREGRIRMVREWAEEAGVAERVHLLGSRPWHELVSTAASAHVGLVPIYPNTLNNYLGDTNKIFEYLMAGIPVVASDLPEIRRVALDGQPRVGEIFDPHSPESIVRAVRDVLDDPKVYEARRAEARRLALEKFNWEIEERTLLGLYGRVSENGSSSNRNGRARAR